jgi:hypothetical protein
MNLNKIQKLLPLHEFMNRSRTIQESSESLENGLAVVLHNGDKLEYWDGTMFISYDYLKYDLSEVEAETELEIARKHCIDRNSATMPYIDRSKCQPSQEAHGM